MENFHENTLAATKAAQKSNYSGMHDLRPLPKTMVFEIKLTTELMNLYLHYLHTIYWVLKH